MKKFVPSYKQLFCAITFIICALTFTTATAEESPLINGLIFQNARLISGTDKEIGATYHFANVSTGIDAIVSIKELINGAIVKDIDDDGGAGFRQAFQPRVQNKGNFVGLSYAVFTMQFYKAGTYTPATLDKMQATAIDLDGNNNLKEFASLNMHGGLATYMGATLDINVQKIGDRFDGINVNGIERDNIDTLALSNMFTVSNSNVTGLDVAYGALTTKAATGNRQYSLYLKGFQYPNQVTLPLHLLSFHSMLKENKVTLTWTTEQEKNVSHFVVERSTDGSSYSQAAIVMAMNGEGSSNYSFKDDISKLSANMFYYRLHWFDVDGQSKMSEVRVIKISASTETMSLATYPNPVLNELRVTIPAQWQGEEVVFQVFGQQGRMMVTQKASQASQTEMIPFKQLPAGVYVVRAVKGNEVAQQRIIKN